MAIPSQSQFPRLTGVESSLIPPNPFLPPSTLLLRSYSNYCNLALPLLPLLSNPETTRAPHSYCPIHFCWLGVSKHGLECSQFHIYSTFIECKAQHYTFQDAEMTKVYLQSSTGKSCTQF